MLRGEGLSGLVEPMGLLAALGVLVFGLAILRFRRDLAPSGRQPQEPSSPHQGDEVR